MQTDPIGYDDGINWYDYVDGDPLNRSDPTGEVGFLIPFIPEIVEAIGLGIEALEAAGVTEAATARVANAARATVAATAAERMAVNAANGARRNAQVTAELKAANPGSKVQAERMLRTADGKKAIDPVTRTGRRVDQAVITNGKAKTVETTSMTADKAAQARKEKRILENGGTFIRDKDTGKMIPVEGQCKLERRC